MGMQSDFIGSRDKAFFKAAKAVSTLSDHRCKIGCVIVDKHRIISSGSNSDTKCHPIQADLDKRMFNCECAGKLHAEVASIIPLLKYKPDLSRSILYTYREHKDGTLAMSRPCSRCMQLIKSVGIKRIRYTTPDGFASEILEEVNL